MRYSGRFNFLRKGLTVHQFYKELGNSFAKSWGFDDGGDLDKTIRQLDHEKLVVSLLSSIANSLLLIRNELKGVIDTNERSMQEQKKKESQSDALADGLLLATRELLGDVPIEKMDLSKLSLRARKALKRSGLKMRSQITKDAMMQVRGCWVTTSDELVQWASSVR
jgi:hypothetical protein